MRRIQLYLLFIAFALTLLLILVDSQSAALWAQTPVATATTVPITAFIHPSAGDAVAGFVTLTGSVQTRNCLKYSLDMSVAGRESWKNLIVEYRCAANIDLYTFDSKQYEDGFYDLRLRAIRNDGNFQETLLRGLEIRNSFPPTPTPAFDSQGSPLPTPQPTALPLPTATLQPAIRHQIPVGQGFYQPEIGESVAGYVDIVGSVYGFAGREFQRYDLFISPAGNQQWTWLYSGADQHWQNTLYVLDSTRFPDGYYDLLLRNVYFDSNYDEFILRYVRIANTTATTNKSGKVAPSGSPQQPVTTIQQPGILSPHNNEVVQGILEVRGVAVDPNFLRWELYWSPSSLEQWAFLTSGSKPVAGGLLAKLDLSNLAGTAIDLRMRIVRTNYNYDEYFVRRVTLLSPPTPTSMPTSTLTPAAP